MAPLPGLYNPKVYRRVDWIKDITIKDSGGTAINLNGSTMTASAWNKERSKKYCDISCSVTDAANGKVRMSMTEAQTTILPDSAYYDLKRSISGNTEYVIYGELKVKEGYTE